VDTALVIALIALVLALLRLRRPITRARVEAEQFFLKDRTGRLRASLDLASGALPTLRFWRKDDSLGATLGLGVDEQPQLSLHDKGQVCRLRLAPDEDGSPRVYLYGADGVVRVQLTAVGKDAGLLITDGSEVPRVYLALQDAEPVLYLTDENGNRTVRLVASRNRGATVRLCDSDERARAEIGMTPGQGGYFALQDGAGRPAAEIKALDSGGCIVTVDPNGEAVWRSPSRADQNER
jgi:hypothetical protein